MTGCVRAARRWPPPAQVAPTVPAVLAVLATPTVAVLLLVLAGVLPRWPGLVHLLALPPADLHADLRILLVRATSVPAFCVLLVALLAVRVTVLSLLLGGLSWPRVRFLTLWYVGFGVPLALAAQMEFTAQAVLYSRLFWAAIALLALVWLLAAPLPWQHTSRLRTAVPRAWRAGLRVDVLVPYAVLLVLLGALADAVPALTAVLVPVSALLTALAVVLLRRPAPSHPGRRLAAVAAGGAVVTVAFVVTRGGVEREPPAAPRDGSLLLMSGINSASGTGAIFETDVAALGYGCDQTFYFSYAGPGDGQPRGAATCPLTTGEPYGPADTQRPLREQVAAFAEQVSDLPRPLVVAGHSHAVWVAWQAVATGAAPQVDVLLLVGPFPESPVGYPPAGHDGEGRIAGYLLRLIVPLGDLVDFDFDPDAPAARQLLATPDAASRLLERPLPPDVRALSMTAVTDLPLMPGGWRMPVERNACPMRVPHPYLPLRDTFSTEVNRFLDGRPALPCPALRPWGAPLSRPLGTPPHDAW